MENGWKSYPLFSNYSFIYTTLITFNLPGASPDGIVDCNCCGAGLVEVKCPFTVRHQPSASWNLNWLERDGSNLSLKREHQYYYQVQAQLFLCEKQYCDLVIWSEKSIVIDRIVPDAVFWSMMCRKFTSFHKNAIMPELVARSYTCSLVPITNQGSVPETHDDNGNIVMNDN